MTKLIEIEGIGEVYAAKLTAAGFRSLEDFLKKAASPADRKAIAEKLGLSDDKILEWANRADLFRIKGVGSEYSDLLEAVGVDTVVELSKRNPENLLEKLIEVNGQKKLVRRLPVLNMLKAWIAEAGKLPRILTY